MSIYPVQLSEWFPFGEEQHDTARYLVESGRCPACGDRMRWRKAVGDHSIPWGYGEPYCDWKCLRSNKKAKPDKRYERRLRRKYGRINTTYLNAEGSKKFLEYLKNPPAPTEALKKAMEKE